MIDLAWAGLAGLGPNIKGSSPKERSPDNPQG